MERTDFLAILLDWGLRPSASDGRIFMRGFSLASRAAGEIIG
jgi:hypothetical protein